MELKVFDSAKPISRGEVDGLIYLYGDQMYLMDHTVDRIIKKFGIDDEDVLLFEGERIDLDRLCEEIVNISFFQSKICLISHFSPENAKDSLLNKLEDVAEFLGNGNILIIKEEYREENAKTKRAQAKKYRDFTNKNGVLIDCNKPDRLLCIRHLHNFAEKRGISIERDEITLLFDRCGENMLLTETELVKLSAYCGENPIDKEAILKLTYPTTEAAVFTMVGSLMSGNITNALVLLGRLFESREEPAKILGALASSFVDIYRIKAGEYQALSREEVTQKFKYRPNDYGLKKAYNNARNITINQMHVVLDILNDLDVALKSTATEPQILFEKALISIRLALTERGN